jgi:hypothetical protein
VDVLDFNMALLQSHEFIVGAVVAAILLGAFFGSSLFRNVALALAAGGVVLLYLQGGVANLVAISQTVANEFRAIPNFSKGMMVGVAITTILMLSFRPRTSS